MVRQNTEVVQQGGRDKKHIPAQVDSVYKNSRAPKYILEFHLEQQYPVWPQGGEITPEKSMS